MKCIVDPELRVRLAAPATIMAFGNKMIPYLRDMECIAVDVAPELQSGFETALSGLAPIPEAQETLMRLRNIWTTVRSKHAPEAADTGSCSWATTDSLLSFATAPAKSDETHCFLPDTIFRTACGHRFLRAAELSGAGGDSIQGPDGSTVLVLSAIKHPPKERDLVRLWVLGTEVSLAVTADHRLLIKGEGCEPAPCSAADVQRRVAQGVVLEIFDGIGFNQVKRAEALVEATQVVEVQFHKDAIALVWLLPRRNRSASVHGFSVAVQGKEFTFQDAGFDVKRTFISDVADVRSDKADKRRSRSCDGVPNPRSQWSVGT